MPWFYFAMLSALANSIISPLKKDLSKKVDSLEVLWMPNLLSAPVYIALIFWQGLPSFTGNFLWYFLFTVIIESIAGLLIIYALKIDELSGVVPMLSLATVFSFFLNIFFLNSPFQTFGLIGVLLVISGSLIAHAKIKKNRLYLKFSLGSVLAIVVSILWAFGTIGIVLGIKSSNLLGFISALNLVIGVVIFLVDIVILGNPFPKKQMFKADNIWLATLSIVSWIAEFTAISLIAQPAYVSAVKRLDIILDIIYGRVLLKEVDFIQKIVAGTITVAGVLIIIFIQN